tara:strand:- start:587 stop:853 length:267 start_codon:yes stop_codon:yes gene_type:complete
MSKTTEIPDWMKKNKEVRRATGNDVKAFRIDNGMNQEQLAVVLDVCKTTISQNELRGDGCITRRLERKLTDGQLRKVMLKLKCDMGGK